MGKKTSTKRSKATGAALVWPADELPFIREIFAQRFDDGPRLVFADWLEERGDPRAEFIRLQCRLAKLRACDPEFPALEAREMELLYKHRKTWMKYPTLAGMWWGIKDGDFRPHPGYGGFTRGLFAAASVNRLPAFLRNAELLVDELGMHELEIQVHSRDEADALAKLPQLARLDVLYLESTARLLASPHIGPLSRLHLHTGSPDFGVLRSFLEGPQSARLRWVSITATDPAKVLRAVVASACAAQIDTLMLRGPHSAGWTSLAVEHGSLRLSRLYCNLADFCSCQQLQTSPALSDLVTLHLHRDAGTPPETWSRLLLPPRVVELAITGGADRLPAEALSRIPDLSQLETLDLSGQQLNDQHAAELARRSLPNLHTLNLNHNLLTAAGVEALVRSDHLPQLRRMEIACVRISNGERHRLLGELRAKTQ